MYLIKQQFQDSPGQAWKTLEEFRRGHLKSALQHARALSMAGGYLHESTSTPYRVTFSRIHGANSGREYLLADIPDGTPVLYFWEAEDIEDEARALMEEAQEIRRRAAAMREQGERALGRRNRLEHLTSLCFDDQWPAGPAPGCSEIQTCAEL